MNGNDDDDDGTFANEAQPSDAPFRLFDSIRTVIWILIEYMRITMPCGITTPEECTQWTAHMVMRFQL